MIEIKHRYTGAVLCTVDANSLTYADLTYADLTYADLTGTDLTNANLTGADLTYARLTGADLTGADLTHAVLTHADLTYARLTGADLTGADLTHAVLTHAVLRNADLRNADLTGAIGLTSFTVCGEGALRVYKKCRDGAIITLEIPRSASRVNAYGSRKCRADCAVVVDAPFDGAVSLHDGTFTYRVGQTVRPHEPFNADPRIECASGIHFFITRAEAEAY
jgi:hypothetical protein